MQNHLDSEGVQESGCLAIGNLAFEPDCRHSVNSQLLQAIVHGMDKHAASLSVQEAGVFAIYNLICTAECYDLVQHCGALEVVERAARNHRELQQSAEVQTIIGQFGEQDAHAE